MHLDLGAADVKKKAVFSQETLAQALRDLKSGKTVDQYDLPASVKASVAALRYSSEDIAKACAHLPKRRRVFKG